MFKLAELFVDIKARDEAFNQQLDATHGRLTGWGVAVGTAVGTLAAGAITAAGSSLAGFFADGISGAVSLQETLSKVNAIFGDSGSIITEQADAMAAKFGVVKQEYLDAASGFGASFKAAGMAADEAAGIGNKLAKLGMDMASFGNASNEEVFTALNSALRGEFDPLERFNVMLNAASVEAYALSHGMAASSKEITEAVKKQATLSLILEKTTDQQGDLERTADGSANQWRKLTGTFTNMAVELGGKLEPALNALLIAGNGVVDSLGPGIEWLGGMFTWFADGVVEAVDTIGLVWRNLGDVWDLVVINAREMYGNIMAVLSVLPENVGRIAAWIGENWYQLLADGFNASATILTNFGENLGNLAYAVYAFLTDPMGGFNFEWKPLTEGFEATIAELPELAAPAWVDLQDEIDAVGKKIEARESERIQRIDAARKAAAAGAKAQAGPAAAGAAGEFKSQSYEAADFSRKLTLQLMGGDDMPKKQLAAAEKTAKHTGELARAANKPAVAKFA